MCSSSPPSSSSSSSPFSNRINLCLNQQTKYICWRKPSFRATNVASCFHSATKLLNNWSLGLVRVPRRCNTYFISQRMFIQNKKIKQKWCNTRWLIMPDSIYKHLRIRLVVNQLWSWQHWSATIITPCSYLACLSCDYYGMQFQCLQKIVFDLIYFEFIAKCKKEKSNEIETASV